MNELITVIIPIYNVEKYIYECVYSVLKQTYTNLEIILVDDGSPDNCGKICDDYAKKDSRIKIIHKPNGGLSDARNSGIDIASGEYITFIDSDDFIAEDMIEYMYLNAVKNHTDISVCQKQPVDEDGNIIFDKLQCEDICIHGSEEALKYYFKTKKIQSVAWGKLYKRELFVALRYPKDKYCEDEFTTYRAIAKTNILYIGKEKKYFYRQRTGSIMNSTFSYKHLDVIDAALERKNFIEKKFPKLTLYANGSIIHAVNQCIIMFLNSTDVLFDIEPKLKEFQKYYRKYEKDFLRCNNCFAAKLFSVCAFINVKLAMKLFQLVIKLKWRNYL